MARPRAGQTLTLKEDIMTTVTQKTVQRNRPAKKHYKTPAPSLDTLMRWEAEDGCEATDGCWVEPDGVCPHGHESWLLVLGLI